MISSTLSLAMIRKGDRPKAATRFITFQEKPPQPSRTGIRLRSRETSTKAQEAHWEITVATAAPATPMSKTKMNNGSRAMLSTAPSMTVAIPSPEKPWQIKKLFMPVAIRAKKVPAV